jgi:carbonic anhydrase/SulP family sulfate permease
MEMFREGRYQFLPFLITLVAIVFTDLIIGILIGLVISVAFILNSNIRRPVNKWIDKHVGGDVIHIRLANQVSFLNRAALENELFRAPPGSHVLLDAKDTDYIDPDILSLIRDFQRKTAPAHGIWVSTRGFKPKFQIPDCVQFVESTTREIQACMTPTDVLEVLRQGNRRFLSGTRLKRDLGRQLQDTAAGQHPLAVILSCIDSRSPAELIFDTGLGDIFTIRIAGNVVRSKVLGSMEFACAFAGAKLILVMGHTRCGAVNASIDLTCSGKTAREANGCEHLDLIVHEISKSIDLDRCALAPRMSKTERQDFTDEVARCNVQRAVELIPKQSSKLRRLLEEKKIVIVGAMYDVSTGEVHFLPGTDQDYSGAATREHAAH